MFFDVAVFSGTANGLCNPQGLGCANLDTRPTKSVPMHSKSTLMIGSRIRWLVAWLLFSDKLHNSGKPSYFYLHARPVVLISYALGVYKVNHILCFWNYQKSFSSPASGQQSKTIIFHNEMQFLTWQLPETCLNRLENIFGVGVFNSPSLLLWFTVLGVSIAVVIGFHCCLTVQGSLPPFDGLMPRNAKACPPSHSQLLTL